MLRGLAAFCVAAMAMGTPALAAGTLYDCKMDTKNPRGWVSPRINIVFDDQGKVSVIDSVTLYFLERPAQARAVRQGDNIRLSWNIAGARDSRGARVPTMRYIANLNQSTKKIRVVAKPVGAPQRWSKTGTCRTKTS